MNFENTNQKLNESPEEFIKELADAGYTVISAYDGKLCDFVTTHLTVIHRINRFSFIVTQEDKLYFDLKYRK